MVRFDLRKLMILLLLASPAAQAQLWSGPAAVEIQVEDQKGAPVADAALKLQYKGVDPKDGPPPLATDARGRANVSGLAEGPWQLEVTREGFMTYIAEVNVRAKGRPTLEEALVLAGSGALRSMKVRITRGRPAPVPPQEPASVGAKKTAEKPAPAPRPATPRPVEPRPQIQPPPEPAPVPRETPPAPPALKPEPVPAPQEAPPTPQQTPPAPQPAPQPVAPPAPPARQPVVRPDPGATPPTIPPIHPVRMRTAKDRTCPDCQPGESAMSTEVLVTSGGAGCGSITSTLKSGVVGELPAGCHVLKVTLPAGAKYSGYRYEIQAGGDSFDCPAGRDCPGSSGRWPVDPVIVKNAENTTVLAPFEGGSGQQERRAVFTVYFKGK